MPYIYKITNDVNGKIYIGKTIKTIESRWKEHLSDYNKSRNEKRPLYDAMIKYGIEHFSIEKIEECSTENLNERERYWIEFFGSFKFGYNATIGGDGRPFLDYDLVNQLYSEGYNCSEIEKITGYSDKSIALILSNSGITKQQRQANCGQWQNKIVKMLDKNTGEIIKVFPKIIDAYSFLGKRKSSHIQEVCSGKRKTAYGYRWSY